MSVSINYSASVVLEREQKTRLQAAKDALNEFKQAATDFAEEAKLTTLNIPGNTLKVSSLGFKYFGDLNQVLHEVFFYVAPDEEDADNQNVSAPQKTKLTRMPIGILPALVLATKCDAQIADFFERNARKALFQASYEITDQYGVQRTVVDLFGYGQIATAAKRLANEWRTNNPGVANASRNKMINVLEKLAICMDALAKLLYVPFATWKVTSKFKNEIITILNDVISPVGEIFNGMSDLNHGIAHNLDAFGDRITVQSRRNSPSVI